MDRLGELQAYASHPGTYGAPVLSSITLRSVSNGEMTFAEAAEDDALVVEILRQYYQSCSAAHTAIRDIEAVMREMDRRRGENLFRVMGPSAGLSKGFGGEDLTQKVTQLSKEVKSQLDCMVEYMTRLRGIADAPEFAHTVLRIEQNQHTRLVTKLTVTMGEFQRRQTTAAALCKEHTHRQIKIKYTNLDGSAMDDDTAEQLTEQVLEANTSSYLFQQNKDVLASIIETRNDLYRVEQSMRNLNQLFNDLAFLVHQQDEMLDLVLFNIQRSTERVQHGRVELKKARKYQKKIRHKIIATLALGTLAAGVGVASIFVPW